MGMAKNMAPQRPDTYRLASFFSKIEVDERGCWIWRAATNGACYPMFMGENAHRVAYRWFVEAIPPLYHVDHLCRNKVCVNPGHLEAVTHKVNAERASVFVLTGMCKRGHLATPESVGIMSQGKGKTSHYCLICRRQRKAS